MDATLEMVIRVRKQLAALEDTIRRTRQFGVTFASTARKIQSYARTIVAAVHKMKAKFIELDAAMRTLRNSALKAFTAIVALTGIPLKFFADFQKGMSNVNTLLNASRKELEGYSNQVVGISNKIGESAKALSAALYDIVSAGVASEKSISVLEKSAKAAQAGMTDTKTAANAGIAAINAYGLEIEKLGHIYDLQFSTVRKGVITFAQLAHAQGQLLPSSRKLNVSLDEMYGSFAFLTKVGLNAEQASISLARAFDTLSQEKDKMQALGVSVFDASGEFRGMIEVIEDLSGTLDGLTSEEQIEKLESIGMDIRAARAIVPMIKNLEDFKEVVGDVSDSAGSMNQAYKKAIDNITFHWDRAKQNVINAFMGIGSAFEDEVRDMLDQVTAWAGAIGNFVKQNEEAIKSIIKFTIKFISVITAFALVGKAITALLTPIGLVKVGIIALGAAWYLNVYGIREKTEAAWAAVTTATSVVWGVMEGFWTWLTGTDFETKLKDIKEVVEKGWEIVIDIAGAGWDFIKQYLPEGAAEKIEEVAKIAFEAAIEWTGDAYDSIKKGFETGDWSDALGVAADAFKAGVIIWTSLSLISGTVAAIKTAIIAGLGLAKAAAAGLGGTATILGVISIGISLAEAMKSGEYNDFVKNLLLALAGGFAAYGLTGSVALGSTVFTLLLNLKLGEIIGNWLFTNKRPSRDIEYLYNPELDGIPKRASGGLVFGSGTGTSDSILAMISNGEYIINAESTKKFLPLLEMINKDQLPRFRDGGSPSRYIGDGSGGLDYGLINQFTLDQSNVADGLFLGLLEFLATASKDTQNYGYVVQLVEAIQAIPIEMEQIFADLENEGDKLKEELENILANNNGNAGNAIEVSEFEKMFNKIGTLVESSLNRIADSLDGTAKIIFTGLGDIAAQFNAIKDENGNAVGMGSVIQGLINDFSNADMKGLWNAFTQANNIYAKADITRQMIEQLSEQSKQAIATVLDSLTNMFASWISSKEEKATEAFNEAVKTFEESVLELKKTLQAGGSLGNTQEAFNKARAEAKKANDALKEMEKWQDIGTGAGIGAGAGSLIGGAIGSIIPGIGTLIGAAAGGLIGAIGGAIGGLFGGKSKRDDNAKKDLLERIEKIKEELNTAIEEAFNLNSQDFLGNINNTMLEAVNSGENMAKAIGVSIYGQVKDSLQKVFLWAKNDLIIQYLEPVLEDAKNKIMDSILTGTELDFDNIIDIDDLIKIAKQAEAVGSQLEKMTEEYKEALREAGIDEEIINQLFPEEIDEEAQKLAESISNAFLDAGELSTFSASLGEAIYTNAKDGLIQAFMEAEVYQEMFQKWFELSDINFSGDLETDFANMQSLLEKLKREIREVGMDFDYTEIPTVGNGASLDEGLYGSESYFAPSTLEAGRDMAETFATAIEQFVLTTESLVTSINRLADEIENRKVMESNKDRTTPINLIRPLPPGGKKYYITVNSEPGEDIAKRVVKEIKRIEENEE